MAKRKKKKLGGRRKRRGGLGGINVMSILSVVAGAVGAGYLNKIVPATVNDKLVAGGKMAIGVALPMLSKNGNTKNILAGVGAGFIAVGSVDLLKSFGVLSGDFDIPTINGDILSGEDLDVINGMDDDDNLGEDFLNDDDDSLGGEEDYD